MADLAIHTEDLVKTYGRARNRGLVGLDLEVFNAEVYGFLGPNGAGKSTTIRILLDLIRPTGGRAEVLGADPRAAGPALRRRIGYLAGDFVVDGRQSARDLLTYLGNLRGGVPRARVAQLAQRLDLDLGRQIKGLSEGNRQKVGVVQAFMHEPELLILDEPTSGLDPFLQQEFVAMVREAKANGQTVFMSSHVMSEVQQTADRVGIIREGRLVAVERVEDLRERAVRLVEIHFDAPVPAEEFATLSGVSDLTVEGATLRCRLDGRADALVKAAARHTVVALLSEEPDLEELFFTYYAREGGPAGFDGVGAGDLAAMSLHLVLFGLFFAALAYAVGAATGSRGLALGVGAGIGVLGYLANSVFPQVQGLEWVRNLSPFDWLLGGSPLVDGVQVGHAVTLAVATAVLVAGGTWAFTRRDVAV